MRSGMAAATAAGAERVLLLHGLARTARSMARLGRALEAAGYGVVNWAYPSRRQDVPALVAHCRSLLLGLDDRRTHAVGHSLGGLILRAALQPPLPFPLGRLVLIGTPNRGAGVVTRLRARPLTRWLPGLLGRPAHDLYRDAAWLADWPLPPAETGAIIGTRRFHPLNPSAWINRLHGAAEAGDGTVERDSAQLAAAADSIEIDAAHSLLPGDDRVIAATLRFLQKGRFA